MINFKHNLINKNRLIANCALLVTLASVLFVHPFNQNFRFTLGVVVLSALLLHFPRLPIILTAILSGVGILATRIAIDIFIRSNDLMPALLQALPAFGYYLVFGVFLYFFKIRQSVQDIPVILIKLGIADLLSNFIEFSIRNDLRLSDSAFILPTLAGVAIFRSMLAVYGYYCLRRYGDFILEDERSARYIQLTTVFAQLKAELYFLHKSLQEIEQVMEQSYLLYKQVDSTKAESAADKSSIGGRALKIARDIHEIKKDYYRVINGIENILSNANGKGVTLSEIFFIIEQSTTRFIRAKNTNVKISFIRKDDFVTEQHYQLVSILNNLIINAIEACSEEGIIRIIQTRNEDYIVFRVEDNGIGINIEDKDIIFKPGYSTKYSELTGEMNTGLGLTHVRNIVESMDGKIELDTKLGKGIAFIVGIPFNKLVKDTDSIST